MSMPAVASEALPRHATGALTTHILKVFRKMLESGHPPDDWNQLLAEARAEGQRQRRFASGIAP